MNKNIFLLWQGQLVSQLGSQAYSIAMIYWLMEHTQSASLMSWVMVASTVPIIFFSPIAGAIVDRISRKTVIVAADAIRGILVLSLAVLMLFYQQQQQVILLAFFIFAFVSGVATALFRPAIQACIPDLVDKQDLAKTNALFASSAQATSIAGQALGGILYKLLGAPLLFIVDGVSYLLSAISEFFIKIEEKHLEDAPSVKGSWRNYKADIAAGFHYVQAQRGMLTTLLFAASLNLLLSPIMLMLPFYVSEQLSSSVIWYGLLLAALLGGGIFGNLLAVLVNKLPTNKAQIISLSMLLFCGCMFALANTGNPYVALISMLVAGLSMALFNLQVITNVQQTTAAAFRGRVMSLVGMLSGVALPLGLIISGQLAALTDNNTALIYNSAAGLMLITVALVMPNKSVQHYLSQDIAENTKLSADPASDSINDN